jgi:hypothetical protein
MNHEQLIQSLERFAPTLVAVASDVATAYARWKPPDGAWSILEIVRHLGDEEVEDFRARLELTLRDPAAEWTPIAPEQWATDRKYNDGDLKAAVDRFVSERKKSIAWLKSLKNPDWSSTHTHPKFGSMSAGELLTAWAAHDLLHLRQIAKRLYQLACEAGRPYSAEYAGKWTA